MLKRQNARIMDSVRKLIAGSNKFKSPKKDATPFVKKQIELNNRLALSESIPLWDSSKQGTYIKFKHGILRR